MADLVSILIPTRNRPLLARLCVATALESSDADCEIVVADNGDQSLELPAHPRLRVLPPPGRPLAMPDNWERALDAARGEWVMLLSDKYMLVPGAIGALRREAARRLPVVCYAYGILRQRLTQGAASDADSLAREGGILECAAPAPPAEIRSTQALADVLASVGEYPAWAPMLYTALVHRAVLLRARTGQGPFFFGPCPDIASCLQVLAHTDSYLVTQLPAVMAQYPDDGAEWSTGRSTQVGGAAGRGFLSLLPGDADPRLGRVVAVLMLRTVLEARRRGILEEEQVPDWCFVAAQAAREIESLPKRDRVRLHAALAAELTSAGAPRTAVWCQTRAALGVRAPEPLRRIYMWFRARLRDRPRSLRTPSSGPIIVASRLEALAGLSARLAPSHFQGIGGI